MNTSSALPVFRSRRFKWFGSLLCFSIALFCIFRIVYISSLGENNISNDTFYLTPLLDQILKGTYSWKNFYHDSYFWGHPLFFPILVHILSVLFTNWNIFSILYLGIILTVVKLFLIYDIFTHFKFSFLNSIFFVFLTALVFSISQLSVFEMEFPSIQFAFSQLGFAIALWGLCKFSGHWFGILLMLIGGIFSSLSSANGIASWPAFLLGIFFLDYSRKKILIIWTLGFLVSLLPYLLFRLLFPRGTGGAFISLFNFEFFIHALGWPLAQGFSLNEAFIKGLFALFFLISGAGILIIKKTVKVKKAIPALMLIVFSWVNIWQLCMFRGVLEKWYANLSIPFWIGLLGLAYVFADGFYIRDKKPFPFKLKIGPLWSFCVFATLLIFYLTSNISYLDKSLFLRYRSPVSLTCLQKFESAPTYCGNFLIWFFDNYEELVSFVQVLKNHHLSVFAPKQKWTMQGEEILEKVKKIEDPKVPSIFWSADKTNQSVSFTNFRELNLFLHSPNAVEWELMLPKDLKDAFFRTAVAISESAPLDKESDGATFKVSVQSDGENPETLFSYHLSPKHRNWIPVNISLTRFADKKIYIRLFSEPGKNFFNDWIIAKFPHVSLENREKDKADLKLTAKAKNTDLSEGFPRSTPEDFNFPVSDLSKWVFRNLDQITLNQNKDLVAKVGNDPQMEFAPEMGECISNFSHFTVRILVSKDITSKLLQVYYKLNGQPEFSEDRSFKIPLLGDGRIHSYSFDLRLMEHEREDRLTGFRLDPVLMGDPSFKDNNITISEFRLVRGESTHLCQ